MPAGAPAALGVRLLLVEAPSTLYPPPAPATYTSYIYTFRSCVIYTPAGRGRWKCTLSPLDVTPPLWLGFWGYPRTGLGALGRTGRRRREQAGGSVPGNLPGRAGNAPSSSWPGRGVGLEPKYCREPTEMLQPPNLEGLEATQPLRGVGERHREGQTLPLKAEGRGWHSGKPLL